MSHLASRRLRRACLPIVYCMAERLEPRRLLSAVSWDGGGDGVNWTNRFNWSTDQLPAADNDVTISSTAHPTVQIASGTQSIQSLVSDEAIMLSGSSAT